jgi:urease accessory protein
MNARTIGTAAFFGVALLAEPAFAHHLMGGRTPSTFADGLLSGLGHPIIGLDHFAAVVRSAASPPRTGWRSRSPSPSCWR